jgi:stage IV sporulation protein FB
MQKKTISRQRAHSRSACSPAGRKNRRAQAAGKDNKKGSKKRVIYFHPTVLFFIAVSLFFDFFHPLILLYVIILLHELAHLVCAFYFGVRIRFVKIMPFGVNIRLNDTFLLPAYENIICLAGPLMNIVLLCAALYFKDVMGNHFHGLDFFIGANLTMAAINLLPVLPLDGGRILKVYLIKKLGGIRGTQASLAMSKVFLTLLVLFGLYVLYRTRFNFSILFIVCFLTAYFNEENLNYKLLYLGALFQYKERMREKEHIKVKIIAVKEDMLLRKMIRLFDLNHLSVVKVVDKDARIISTFTEGQIIDALNGDGAVSAGQLCGKW